MFPRARDPDLFPPSAARWSVTIPADAAPDPALAGLAPPTSLDRAVPKRKLEFMAGRVCAREAIRNLTGTAPADALPRDADGCPVWPPGLVGSISHTRRFATAAVALAADSAGLGVDVEEVIAPDAAAEVAGLVATDAELRVAQGAGLDSLAALTLVFSAKESLYKALYPARRLSFDFLDCTVVEVDAGARRFTIRLAAPFDAAAGAAGFAGRWERIGGEVHTGVLVKRPAANRDT